MQSYLYSPVFFTAQLYCMKMIKIVYKLNVNFLILEKYFQITERKWKCQNLDYEYCESYFIITVLSLNYSYAST